jgi:hypothetical protein
MILEFMEGDPPEGYSLVTMDELPYKPMLWFARALKNGSTNDFVLTFVEGMYVLWVKKHKGSGKMIGKGFGKNKLFDNGGLG